MRKLPTYLLLSLSLSATALAQPPRAPEITFGPRAVKIAGLSPRGQAVGFSIAREVAEDDVATVFRRTQLLADDDADGAVEWALDGEVPLRSVWVVVDLATGGVAAAAPEGYPLRRVNWRGVGIVRGSGRADRVEDARTFAEVLLVRPGVGAWRLTLGDGSDRDADGKPDGKLAAELNQLEPLPGITAAPPDRFDPKDVVVLVDPNRMELTVVQAGNPRAAGVKP